jgi:hypothetical protein
MAIMEQINNIWSGLAHLLEPAMCHRSQVGRLRVEPSVDLWVLPLTTGQWEETNIRHDDCELWACAAQRIVSADASGFLRAVGWSTLSGDNCADTLRPWN